MRRFVVVGCGPHGVAVSTALVKAALPGTHVCVADPNPDPLYGWSRRAAGIGMDQMRSPWVHHVAREPMSLLEAVGRAWHSTTPTVAEFESHALAQFSTYPPRLVRAGVRSLDRDTGSHPHWVLGLDDGTLLEADAVVVAVGLEPHRRAGLGGVPIPTCAVQEHGGKVAVVGGGHTATTAVRRLVTTGAQVDLFAPSGLLVYQTDVDAGWFGPMHLNRYWSCAFPDRVAHLQLARRGSTPPGLARWLEGQERDGTLTLVHQRVDHVELQSDLSLVHASGGIWGPYEAVYEGIGYRVDAKNIDWLAPWVSTVSGWPIVDTSLQAAQGLFMTGPLAELELGPAGRNLWGAQRAIGRILEELKRAG